MKLETWKGLILLLGISYLVAIGAGSLICNIGSCTASQAQISGTILQPLFIFSIVGWLYIRKKREKK